MALFDHLHHPGVALSYSDQAAGSSTYDDQGDNDDRKIDGDWDNYSYYYSSGAGAHYGAITLVATFPSGVHLTQLKFKKWTGADGSFGQHKIWVYDGSWTEVYAATGNGSEVDIVTVNGSWKNITKIQYSIRAYANDIVAWTMTIKFFEAQAWGPKSDYGLII